MVYCKPENLVQCAILGSLYAQNILDIENPTVGLINIGEEEGKGNLLAQATYTLLKENPLIHFIGNVEGRDFFNDKADVIVCEGFVGNVVLKMAESFYRMIMKRGRSDEYFDRFNYENYGGTPILGINGTAMIAHGISSPMAFKNMLLQTKEIVEAGLPEKIKQVFN